MRLIIRLFVVLILFCGSLSGLSAQSRIAAAGWCTFTDETDESDTNEEDSVTTDGCDIGIGVSIYHFKRWPHLTIVGVLGSKSTGGGLAWIINPYTPPDDSFPPQADEQSSTPIIAIAIGAITGYDERGVSKNFSLALGATLSLRSRP